jgi:hypothetical protein
MYTISLKCFILASTALAAASVTLFVRFLIGA